MTKPHATLQIVDKLLPHSKLPAKPPKHCECHRQPTHRAKKSKRNVDDFFCWSRNIKKLLHFFIFVRARCLSAGLRSRVLLAGPAGNRTTPAVCQRHKSAAVPTEPRGRLKHQKLLQALSTARLPTEKLSITDFEISDPTRKAPTNATPTPCPATN